MARHLIIDCETVAINDVQTYLEPPTAPSNYKDEAKIAAYIAEESKRQAEKAALDIDLARIVAIGYHFVTSGPDDQPEVEVLLCKDETQEMTNLGKLWDAFWKVYIPGHTVAVTFNGLAYDLPLLLRRSLYLGVTAPKLQLDRYRHIDAIDLMQILCMDGRLKMHGLQFYANRFKIPVEQDITGADIGKSVADGDWAAVEKHCAADVQTTYALAKRMGVL
jgi:DNA polymerase elongation subunit (family B)